MDFEQFFIRFLFLNAPVEREAYQTGYGGCYSGEVELNSPAHKKDSRRPKGHGES